MKNIFKIISIGLVIILLFSCNKEINTSSIIKSNKETFIKGINDNIIGIVQEINGNCYTSGKKSIKLKLGDLISINDTINTKELSNLTIVLKDKSLLRIGEKTKINISKNITSLDFSIDYGYIWGRILQTQESKYNYNFQNNDIIAAIRGTSFFMDDDNIINIDSGNNKGISIKCKTYNKDNLIYKNKSYSYSDGKIENTINSELFVKNSFIKESTKKDLLYMYNLTEKNISKELYLLINNELRSTEPNKQELLVLFNNVEIIDLLNKNERLVSLLKKDDILTKIKNKETKSNLNANILGVNNREIFKENTIKKLLNTNYEDLIFKNFGITSNSISIFN